MNSLSKSAVGEVAQMLNVPEESITVQSVTGGYSRNRRGLLHTVNGSYFAKEVDLELLDDDGQTEMGWLKKEYEIIHALQNQQPEIVSDYVHMNADGTLLLTRAYPPAEGWLWQPPQHPETLHRYIDAVVAATTKLEEVTFSVEQIADLQLEPYFRDKLAHYEGIDAMIEDSNVRQRVQTKCGSVALESCLKVALDSLIESLDDDQLLQQIKHDTRALANVPQDRFNHCDVRSDNLCFNPETGQIKMVDWNWASYAPAHFGPSEFLIDMARRGVDVAPWKDYMSREDLAAMIGFYAHRCINDELQVGGTLRTMQAETAAVALTLYKDVIRSKLA